MKYNEIIPGEQLRPYVKRYFVFDSESDLAISDTVFPSGNPEFIFNLGTGIWKSTSGQGFEQTPPIEMWGQLTQPLSIKASGINQMLGIRFHAHSLGYFLGENISEFNNRISDLRSLLGKPIMDLHEQLMNSRSLTDKISLLEAFLLSQLCLGANRANKISIVTNAMNDMKRNGFKDKVESIARRRGVSARYMHELFVQFAGITPKLYCTINRFQHSLVLLNQKERSLTDVAYEAGFFDQSHFIREFKSFTGITPSEYSNTSFPINSLLAIG